MRFIGENAEIDPGFDQVQIVWIKTEHTPDNWRYPSVWFLFGGDLYYGVSSYPFHWLEQHEDIQLPCARRFDAYSPGREEWEWMAGSGMSYAKLDYEKAMRGDLGEWCDFEIEFATRWNRDKKIDSLLH